jgi:hypothetical protein
MRHIYIYIVHRFQVAEQLLSPGGIAVKLTANGFQWLLSVATFSMKEAERT